MSAVHFLNVCNGDCVWIEHPSGRNTVIDISNGQEVTNISENASLCRNHRQKNYPVDPIKYLKDRGVETIFRFILTHPDMDHMDGIKRLFDTFDVVNFWDTENTKEMDGNSGWGRYDKADWDFYQEVRTSSSSPKVLYLYAGQKGKYFSEDGLSLLAPTEDLVKEANESEDYNDCSYVILYRTKNDKKIIFAGDSAEKTWDYILKNYKEDVKDVDVLIAPHHGRKTGGNDKYLDVLKPKLTLFGNAESKYLDYSSWNRRELDHITNNQANCIIINTDGENGMGVYVTCKKFAKERNLNTYYDKSYAGWYIMTII